jgi:hypothetical protein
LVYPDWWGDDSDQTLAHERLSKRQEALEQNKTLLSDSHSGKRESTTIHLSFLSYTITRAIIMMMTIAVYYIEAFLFRDWGLSSRPMQSLGKSPEKQEYFPEATERLAHKRSLIGGKKELFLGVFPHRKPWNFRALIVVDLPMYVCAYHDPF